MSIFLIIFVVEMVQLFLGKVARQVPSLGKFCTEVLIEVAAANWPTMIKTFLAPKLGFPR